MIWLIAVGGLVVALALTAIVQRRSRRTPSTFSMLQRAAAGKEPQPHYEHSCSSPACPSAPTVRAISSDDQSTVWQAAGTPSSAGSDFASTVQLSVPPPSKYLQDQYNAMLVGSTDRSDCAAQLSAKRQQQASGTTLPPALAERRSTDGWSSAACARGRSTGLGSSGSRRAGSHDDSASRHAADADLDCTPAAVPRVVGKPHDPQSDEAGFSWSHTPPASAEAGLNPHCVAPGSAGETAAADGSPPASCPVGRTEAASTLALGVPSARQALHMMDMDTPLRYHRFYSSPAADKQANGRMMSAFGTSLAHHLETSLEPIAGSTCSQGSEISSSVLGSPHSNDDHEGQGKPLPAARWDATACVSPEEGGCASTITVSLTATQAEAPLPPAGHVVATEQHQQQQQGANRIQLKLERLLVLPLAPAASSTAAAVRLQQQAAARAGAGGVAATPADAGPVPRRRPNVLYTSTCRSRVFSVKVRRCSSAPQAAHVNCITCELSTT